MIFLKSLFRLLAADSQKSGYQGVSVRSDAKISKKTPKILKILKKFMFKFCPCQ